jgi:hypothetical protein
MATDFPYSPSQYRKQQPFSNQPQYPFEAHLSPSQNIAAAWRRESDASRAHHRQHDAEVRELTRRGATQGDLVRRARM